MNLICLTFHPWLCSVMSRVLRRDLCSFSMTSGLIRQNLVFTIVSLSWPIFRYYLRILVTVHPRSFVDFFFPWYIWISIWWRLTWLASRGSSVIIWDELLCDQPSGLHMCVGYGRGLVQGGLHTHWVLLNQDIPSWFSGWLLYDLYFVPIVFVRGLNTTVYVLLPTVLWWGRMTGSFLFLSQQIPHALPYEMSVLLSYDYCVRFIPKGYSFSNRKRCLDKKKLPCRTGPRQNPGRRHPWFHDAIPDSGRACHSCHVWRTNQATHIYACPHQVLI